MTGPGGTGTSAASFSVTVPPTVTVKDYFFKPLNLQAAQGQAVRWRFRGPSAHTATDSIGLGVGGAPLFDSGSRGAGELYDFVFQAAGTYPYASTNSEPSPMTGTINVPLVASPASGTTNTSFAVTWSPSALLGVPLLGAISIPTPGLDHLGLVGELPPQTDGSGGHVHSRPGRGHLPIPLTPTERLDGQDIGVLGSDLDLGGLEVPPQLELWSGRSNAPRPGRRSTNRVATRSCTRSPATRCCALLWSFQTREGYVHALPFILATTRSAPVAARNFRVSVVRGRPETWSA